MAQEHSNCWDRKQLWAILVEKLIVTTMVYVHAQTSWDLRWTRLPRGGSFTTKSPRLGMVLPNTSMSGSK